MAETPDYYAVLGVPPDADPAAIKKAWRSLARQLHPDLPMNAGDPTARTRFAQVQEAYEVLSDAERRRAHDARPRRHRTWSKAGRAPGSRVQDAADIELQTDTGSGVASIFADLFGMAEEAPRPSRAPSGSGPSRPRPSGGARPASRPRPMMGQDLAAGLAEAVGMPYGGRGAGEEPAPGAEWTQAGFDAAAGQGHWSDEALAAEADSVAFGRDEPAPEHYESPWDPSRMNAEGFASADDINASLNFDPGARPQAQRSGRGPQGWDPPADGPAPPRSEARDRGDDLRIPLAVPLLTALQGGRVPLTYRVPQGGRYVVREIQVPIPERTEHGAEITLRGLGVPGRHGTGDLKLAVAVQEHPVFRLEGDTLVADLPVTPWEAAGGCEVDVPTLHGRSRVRVPPGCRSGARLRLRGLGAFGGDQHLIVRIQLPDSLNEEALELLRRFDLLTEFDPRRGWGE